MEGRGEPRGVFESITKETIFAWIAAKRDEDLYLDFKEASSTDVSHKDDRKNFAVALSGFANADGGLAVWGVKAKYDPVTKINCAMAPAPIADTRQFLTKLNEFTGSFVSPLVPSVRHRQIVSNGTEGFIVTVIPASDLGPHMAKGGEGRY
jgi:predicted HTH transcriptional regulator